METGQLSMETGQLEAGKVKKSNFHLKFFKFNSNFIDKLVGAFFELINQFLYPVEFSFLISLTFFNFFNSNNQNIHLRDLSFTNIKNSYINVFKNY